MKLPNRCSWIFFSLLIIGNLCCQTDVRAQSDEARLDSLWRKEIIWNLGFTKINGESIMGVSEIELPRWAKWRSVEEYCEAQMKYPSQLLESNEAGYAVVMFPIDTLGLPRAINVLTTTHKEFADETIRLIKELPHCLPCRDENDSRIECFYTAYIPFLPQRYRDRVKADSLIEEKQKHWFIEWDDPAKFQSEGWLVVFDYIYRRLSYDPLLLGEQNQAKGFYDIKIDSYGEIMEAKTRRSCGIREWDDEVLKILKGMPRWTPAVNYYGKGEYRSSFWTIPIVFENKGSKVHDKKE